MLTNVLPLSNETSCNSDLLVWGIKMSVVRAPLHMVHLCLPLVTGHVKIAVLPRFPISGVSFILGDDLARGNVIPLPEVVDVPVPVACLCPALPVPNVFPECEITHAQARKKVEDEDLFESFMATLDESELLCSVLSASENEKVLTCSKVTDLFPADTELCLNVTREMLITAQKNDPSVSLFVLCYHYWGKPTTCCVFFLTMVF